MHQFIVLPNVAAAAEVYVPEIDIMYCRVDAETLPPATRNGVIQIWLLVSCVVPDAPNCLFWYVR